MRAGVIVGLGLSLLAACLPTIDIGSNLAGSTSSGPADGNEGAMADEAPDEGTATSTAGDSDAGATGSGTAGSEGGTTQGAVDDGTDIDSGSDGDGDGSSSSESSGGQSCADFFPVDVPCLQCAEDQCCDEIELCTGQPECADCFLACIQGGAPPDICQTGCAPASGTAAIVTCLTLACMVSC